jgi:hypothetical protein
VLIKKDLTGSFVGFFIFRRAEAAKAAGLPWLVAGDGPVERALSSDIATL